MWVSENWSSCVYVSNEGPLACNWQWTSRYLFWGKGFKKETKIMNFIFVSNLIFACLLCSSSGFCFSITLNTFYFIFDLFWTSESLYDLILNCPYKHVTHQAQLSNKYWGWHILCTSFTAQLWRISKFSPFSPWNTLRSKLKFHKKSLMPYSGEKIDFKVKRGIFRTKFRTSKTPSKFCYSSRGSTYMLLPLTKYYQNILLTSLDRFCNNTPISGRIRRVWYVYDRISNIFGVDSR